jgi:hypothetical protein
MKRVKKHKEIRKQPIQHDALKALELHDVKGRTRKRTTKKK